MPRAANSFGTFGAGHTNVSLEERLALAIARTRRILFKAAGRSLEAEHGETLHHYRILAHLIRSGTSTQKDLAEATAQHPAAISRLLNVLDRRGLVRRKRKGSDRRNVHVVPTAAGRARFHTLAPAVRSGVTDALQPLSVAERKRLVALLGKLGTG
jgi:DNA-binding MarR family transcriptional regulator